MRHKNRRRTALKTNISFVLIVALMAVFLAYTAYIWTFRISPNLDNIAEMKAKLIVSKTVNEAIREKLYEDSAAEKLLTVKTNDDGTVEMVQSNTAAINKLLSDLSSELQGRYRNGDLEQKAAIPIGSLLGSRVLSQYGPYINLTIMPIAVSHVDFVTEFETQGINQTKYKVYALLNTEVRVLAPFTTGTIEIENTII